VGSHCLELSKELTCSPCDAQLDFLEHPSVNDVVVLTTVLEEVRRD
jgi:hypothetical protein